MCSCSSSSQLGVGHRVGQKVGQEGMAKSRGRRVKMLCTRAWIGEWEQWELRPVAVAGLCSCLRQRNVLAACLNPHPTRSLASRRRLHRAPQDVSQYQA